jgi:hypothetical protein
MSCHLGDVYNSMPIQHHQLSIQQQQAQQQLNAYGHNSHSTYRDPSQMSNYQNTAQPHMTMPSYLNSPTFGTLNTPQDFVDELGEDSAGDVYRAGVASGAQGQQQKTSGSSPLTMEGGAGSDEQIDGNQLSQAFDQLSTNTPTAE